MILNNFLKSYIKIAKKNNFNTSITFYKRFPEVVLKSTPTVKLNCNYIVNFNRVSVFI